MGFSALFFSLFCRVFQEMNVIETFDLVFVRIMYIKMVGYGIFV